MIYKLRILSPLHIGCGEEYKYSGLSYLIDKRKTPPLISILNEDLVLGMLDDIQIKSFVKWLETEKFPNLYIFFRKVLKDENFAIQNQLQKRAIYAIPYYAGDERLKQINCFIKQMHQPYIPGTEIKGAIRTAVLYCSLLGNKDIFLWFKYKLKKFQKDNLNAIFAVANSKKPNPKIKKALARHMAKIESEFQEKILYCKPKDAKYDVMKYVQVGDSELMDAGNALAISYVKPFNISKKFHHVFYEYIKPEIEATLTMLTLENTKSLTVKLDKMAFSNRHKDIVNGIDTIFNHCYHFSKDLLDEEISFFQTMGNQQIVKQLNEIALLNKPETPVLRIGKDEGYNSLTVGLAVRKLDKNLYENVLIHATKNKSYDSTHGGPMPKSRKIVCWDGAEITPGWVQLIHENDHNDYKVEGVPRSNPETPPDFSMLEKKFKVARRKQ